MKHFRGRAGQTHTGASPARRRKWGLRLAVVAAVAAIVGPLVGVLPASATTQAYILESGILGNIYDQPSVPTVAQVGVPWTMYVALGTCGACSGSYTWNGVAGYNTIKVYDTFGSFNNQTTTDQANNDQATVTETFLSPGYDTVSFDGTNGGAFEPATGSQTVEVTEPPSFTTVGSTTFIAGSAGTYNVGTAAFPAPSLSVSGQLPGGVSFVDNGNGTGSFTGSPTIGSGGTYDVTITASNGVGSPATQNFALTVDQHPAIISASSTTMNYSALTNFSFLATGFPAPTFTETGALPDGVTLSSSGLLSGTPTQAGDFPVTVTASNGIVPAASQSFDLVVQRIPSFTSAAFDSMTAGSANTFSVATVGYPTSTLTETGNLPSGVTFTDNGTGTATLAGTPSATSGGEYNVVFGASNGTTDASQSFGLTVDATPTFTSPTGINVDAGAQFMYSISTKNGFPTPLLSETAQLPSGVTFTDNGNGTGTLSGEVPVSGEGPTGLTFVAAGDPGGPVTQAATLNVEAPSAPVTCPTGDICTNPNGGTQTTTPTTTPGSTTTPMTTPGSTTTPTTTPPPTPVVVPSGPDYVIVSTVSGAAHSVIDSPIALKGVSEEITGTKVEKVDSLIASFGYKDAKGAPGSIQLTVERESWVRRVWKGKKSRVVRWSGYVGRAKVLDRPDGINFTCTQIEDVHATGKTVSGVSVGKVASVETVKIRAKAGAHKGHLVATHRKVMRTVRFAWKISPSTS